MARDHYTQTMSRIAEVVEEHVPEGSTLIAATGGDNALLSLGPRRVLAFPADGALAQAALEGPSGVGAIAHLEVQRTRGATFLLVPESEFWRLDDDDVFERHLAQRYRILSQDDHAVLYSLERAAEETTAWALLRRAVEACDARGATEPSLLDWRTGLDLRRQLPELAVFSPLESGPGLPYLDDTIDLVALPTSASAVEIAEAERVARVAVLVLAADGDETANRVRWKQAPLAAPSASVIVAGRGPSDVFDPFLSSLRETIGDADVEVVVAGSGPRSAPALLEWEAADDRVRVVDVASDAPLGAALNSAAAGARHDVLVYVQPVLGFLPGWLPPLLRLFGERASAGAAAAKLLTPDGELLHAGGDFLLDGSTSVSRGGRPDAPDYACVRTIGYASPTFVATPRHVFAALGGFGGERPSTLTIDYCLRLREQGYDVYYQPETVTVLLESDPRAHAVAR
jgi:hypothetical protein